MSKKLKVAIVVACCCETKAEFGIRFEKSESQWIADWSFLLKPGTAKREGYENTRLDGKFQFASSFPGCPTCQSKTAFVCTCGKVSCWNGEAKTTTCPWCEQRGTLDLERDVESLRVGGDR